MALRGGGRVGRATLALAVAVFVVGCGPEDESGDGGSQAPSEERVEEDVPRGPGPWPTDSFRDYSIDYGVDWVQSASVDAADNIWLLRDREIGVLKPGATSPMWVKNLGQARKPFGRDAYAMGSSVICGGDGGRAYVGYWTYDLERPYLDSPDHEEFTKGDLDVVTLNSDGQQIMLETHLSETTDNSGYRIGIRNSNDWHHDEDRSILTCQRVMKGKFKGDLYVGTNHGVTRIRGLVYNAHRHPVWGDEDNLNIGYSYGLGIAQDGEVLIANDWKVAILTPPETFSDWDKNEKTPWQLDAYAEEVNSEEAFDYWRGFQQTKDGRYFVGSLKYGLWHLERTQWVGDAKFTKVQGAPSNAITALAAAEDGSLFVGTEDKGLWRMTAGGDFHRIEEVQGAMITQLTYDPTVSPPMLLVVSDATLSVLRGH